MQPDDEVCLCFHVTRRKVENWIRVEQPVRSAQLSECFGAGTGCGWCRPFLERLYRQSQTAMATPLPSASQYKYDRGDYIRQGKGTPPAEASD